jgi:succinyl-CoA synthetase beta subunit
VNLHEYQAKLLLKRYGIPITDFQIIQSGEQLHAALATLDTEQVVIKAQIHAGGRGQAGGVKIAKSAQEAVSHVKNMLKMKIVNKQTGPDGAIAEMLLVAPLVSFRKEYYLGATIDRKNSRPVLIASPYGGMEIEKIAEEHPEAILQVPIELDGLIRSYHVGEVAKFMGWTGVMKEHGMHIVEEIAKAFVELDASLLEINPLVSLEDETLSALDVKLAIDDNALFRHKEVAAQFDEHQIHPLEALARHHDLAYIALDGDIGCMVNGAGLAMATMDIIEYYGGHPANFLDIGGGASQEKVAQGFKIILSDSKVKAILVNIFGGIMNCETLAAGMIAAINSQGIKVPLIVRMEGTNVAEGKELLAKSGLKIRIANSLAEAAELSVMAVN